MEKRRSFCIIKKINPEREINEIINVLKEENKKNPYKVYLDDENGNVYG